MMSNPNEKPRYRMIVLVEDANRVALDMVRFVKSMTEDVTAFHAMGGEADAAAFLCRWERLQTGVPCICRVPEPGGITETLMRYIRSDEYRRSPSDILAVVLPRLISRKRWLRSLDNGISKAVERRLLENENIAVVVYPYQLMDDETVFAKDTIEN